jgi:hypothetical protein
MRPFNRRADEPRRDPIGEVCRSLSDLPHEWKSVRVRGDTDNQFGALRHQSGAVITFACYASPSSGPDVWFGNSSDPGCKLIAKDAWRVFNAIQARTASLVSRRVYRFTDTALALAAAVTAGDHTAALGLADEIIEHHN